MAGVPDLIGLELNEGLDYLKENGLTYKLLTNDFPGKTYPIGLLKRIVRIRMLDSKMIEVTYSVDTYRLGNESDYKI